METAVFAVAAITALVAAVAMVLARNSVHAALLLVMVQVALAVLFLLQGAFFIAALQIILYAGAIMVLFVFVLMLLGIDEKESLKETLPYQKLVGVGLGMLLILEALYLGISGRFKIPAVKAVKETGEGNVERIATELFTRWAFPFEITSVLLVVAVLAVMVLAKKRLS